MSSTTDKINDKWFRFVGIPFIAIMSHVIFFNENNGIADEKFSFWEVILISIAESMVLWEGNRLVLFYFRKRYPQLHQSVKRITGQFLGCMLATVCIRYVNIWLYNETLFWGYSFSAEAYLYNIFVGLLYVIIVAGIYEGIYYFQKWKQLFSETEELKRQNLETQLSSLKAQINPHFLFNNLSSLASLIMEDQTMAVKFVKELSSVYRYLLQANEKNITNLETELTFIKDYFHLLKTRFGDGVDLKIDVPLKYSTYLLPSLTLQILVENAVKHNIAMPQKPLCIRLYTDEADNLLVVNNLQKKNSSVISHKLGLRNIISKYQLLVNKEVVIKQTDNVFQVTIPLIKNEIHESIGSGR